MFRTTKTGAAACAVAVFLFAGILAARAQDATAEAAPDAPAMAAPAPARSPQDPVARVGGEVLTEQDLEIARSVFGDELANVPEEQHRSVLIDALVNMEVLAKAALDAGLDKTPDFEARVEFLRMQALRNAFLEREVINSVTDEAMQEGYQTLVVGEFKPEQEVHARHILVETEEAAKKIIEDLKGGASFEELAKQSKDPSGQSGGDLGFFSQGDMVPPFEAAAFALEPGGMTEEPVQTEFGWHVIRVEEKRMTAPPAFAEVEEQLRNFLVRQKFEATLAGLRDRYGIEILEPAATDEAVGADDEAEVDAGESADAEEAETEPAN